MSLDCSVVIVSWNVQELLLACLRSVIDSLQASTYTFEIIVIDNGSHDDSVAQIRQQFPTVMLIENDENLGFAGGVNCGLACAQGRWVVVLNPDTVVKPDALPLLIEAAEQLPNAVVVGPQLHYGDGSLQSSRRRWPTRLTLFMESTLLERWWPSNPWTQTYHMSNQPFDEQPQVVDWLVGAVLVVRAAAIKQAGGLDQVFWMYSEELEWQQRLAQYGSIWFVPQAVVIHYEGRSSAQIPARKHVAFQQSKLRYAARRFGPGIATLLHLFLLGTYSWEWLVEAAKWLLGHKRPLRRKRLAVYSQVIGALWP